MPLSVPTSGNPYIDGVLWGWKWDSLNLTYSMPASANEYGYGVQGFQRMNSVQAQAVEDAIALADAVCGLKIKRAAAGAVASFRFAEATAVDQERDGSFTSIPTAIGTPPDPDFPAIGHGDMFFNPQNYNNPLLGTFEHVTFIHELGHALGLKHGHSNQSGIPALPADFDSSEYSVMTYRDHVGDDPGDGAETERGGSPQTFMMFDIAALQYMYGADYTTNATNTTYRWSPTTGEMFVNGAGQGAAAANRILLTIWDGGGVDTYDFSNYRTGVTVDLRPGAYSIASRAQLSDLGDGVDARGNVFNAFLHQGDRRSLIENATGGSSNDSLYGNGGVNTLRGGDGRDYLFGFGGNDRLAGGSLADRFAFDDAWGLDTITDWQDSTGRETRYDSLDRIDLTGLRDENRGAALTLADLLIRRSGANVTIELDLNNDRRADRIDLDGDGLGDLVRITVIDAAASRFQNADFLF